MPFNKLPPSLKTEVSKLMKLSHIQNGLAPVMRGLPVAVIFAGDVISKVTKGENTVEQRMLGVDETFMLRGPNEQAPEGKVEDVQAIGSEGVTTLCGSCGKVKKKDCCGHEG